MKIRTTGLRDDVRAVLIADFREAFLDLEDQGVSLNMSMDAQAVIHMVVSLWVLKRLSEPIQSFAKVYFEHIGKTAAESSMPSLKELCKTAIEKLFVLVGSVSRTRRDCGGSLAFWFHIPVEGFNDFVRLKLADDDEGFVRDLGYLQLSLGGIEDATQYVLNHVSFRPIMIWCHVGPTGFRLEWHPPHQHQDFDFAGNAIEDPKNVPRHPSES